MKHRLDVIVGLIVVLVGVLGLSGCGKQAKAPNPPAQTSSQPSATPTQTPSQPPAQQGQTPTQPPAEPAQTSSQAPAQQGQAPAQPSATSGQASSQPPAASGQAPPRASGAVPVSFTDIGGIHAEQAIKDEAALGILGVTTGEFKPRSPITRAEFVRWLVKAVNVYYKGVGNKEIRLAESDDATFVDVPPTHPDFKYIQGMANAGFVVGVDKTHFAPDRPITREEMIAIKAPQSMKDSGIQHWWAGESATELWSLPFVDKNDINKVYSLAVHYASDAKGTQDVVRTWGSIQKFNPKKAVTRAEAAECLSVMGTADGKGFVSAAQTLGRKP